MERFPVPSFEKNDKRENGEAANEMAIDILRLLEYIRSNPSQFRSGACALHGFSSAEGFAVYDETLGGLVSVTIEGECERCPLGDCDHERCIRVLISSDAILDGLRGYHGVLNNNSGY